MNALVLLGGGARGAYQVGVIKAIWETGIPIHIVSGSSVGAINAAVVASGQASKMETYWLDLNTLDVIKPRVNLLRLYNWQAIAKPAETLIRLVRHDLDWKTIREGSTKLLVEATNLKTGKHEVFDNRTCTWKHLLASASIPMIFPPVKLGRKYYVDGSLTQNFPLLPAIEAGVDTLFVVSLTSDKPDRAVPANLYEMAGRTLEIFLHHSLRYDLRQMEKINEYVREKRLKDHRIIRAVTFYPQRDLGDIAQFLLFHRNHTEDLIDLGYKDGKRVLASYET